MSFAETLIDEWVRAGVTDAVLAPGSRSTPLAVACARRDEVRLHVVLDERSASFLALGLALDSGRPVLLGCTSGTAAAQFHAAVIEASQSAVPLIVCTADRPPELQDVGAPQTIDQVGLYGTAVRWATNPGVADPTAAHTWRSLAARAVWEATGPSPGPVHLNLMFREPLLSPHPAEPVIGRAGGRPWHARGPAAPPPAQPWLQERLDGARRPIVVAGRGAPPGLVVDGVPVLGDPRAPYPLSVAHADSLLRDPDFVTAHAPDLVVCAGEAPASKVLAQWVAELNVPRIVLAPPRGWVDPAHVAEVVFGGDLSATVHADAAWTERWHAAADAADDAIASALEATPQLTGAQVARTVMAAVPRGGRLFVSSSMPIRDLEWFAEPRADVTVHANRGANGIDGIVSTATGVALASEAPTVLLTGDLALLHDANGLLGLAARAVDLTIVVVDNGGGGIFSLLPQRDLLDDATFSRLFTTPQHVDLAALGALYGLAVDQVGDGAGLAAALARSRESTGVRLVVAATDIATDVATHRALHDAVARAWR